MNRNESTTLLERAAAVVLVTALFAADAWGQTSYPMLMSLKPTAVQVGQAAEVVIESRYSMFGAKQLLITGEGVTAEVVTPMELDKDGKEPSLTKITVRFTVSPEAAEGVRDVRVITPFGASTLGQLVVTRDPVIQESAKNNTAAEALEFSVPATLCGAIEANEDVDYFKFHLDAPRTLTFYCRSMVLQDKMHDLQQHCDPIVTIRNAAGSTLAAGDNYYAADPLFSHEFKEPGDYFVEIRDVRYQGNRYWEYAVAVHDRPHVITAHPLAFQRGTTGSAELVGLNLPDAKNIEWAVPAEQPAGPVATRLNVGGVPSNPVQLLVVDETPVVETLEPNDSVEQAMAVAVPGVICGRIEAEADIDFFKFDAIKGDRFTFEVISRRLETSLDPILNVLSADGKSLAENDDGRLLGRMTTQDSILENWTAPADGTFVVRLRDVHLRGGSSYPYVLRISRAEPTFELVLDTDKTPLTPGTAGVLFARVVRKNGFAGAVQLSIDGLPAGVTATCGVIPPELQDGVIVLEAGADAVMTGTNVTVRGTAVVGDAEAMREVSIVARPMQETYMPGGGRSHWPVAVHTVSIGKPSDLTGVKVEPRDVSLKPGETVKLEIEIQRAPGFDKNVTLDMLFQHLSSRFAETLPKGVTIDLKQSKTLLTGQETKGHLTLTAAKDAPPATGQVCCVMANVSINFVMKATYSSSPVLISVVPDAAP